MITSISFSCFPISAAAVTAYLECCHSTSITAPPVNPEFPQTLTFDVRPICHPFSISHVTSQLPAVSFQTDILDKLSPHIYPGQSPYICRQLSPPIYNIYHPTCTRSFDFPPVTTVTPFQPASVTSHLQQLPPFTFHLY